MESDAPKPAIVPTVNIKGDGKEGDEPRIKVEISPHRVSAVHTAPEGLEEECNTNMSAETTNSTEAWEDDEIPKNVADHTPDGPECCSF